MRDSRGETLQQADERGATSKFVPFIRTSKLTQAPYRHISIHTFIKYLCWVWSMRDSRGETLQQADDRGATLKFVPSVG